MFMIHEFSVSLSLTHCLWNHDSVEFLIRFKIAIIDLKQLISIHSIFIDSQVSENHAFSYNSPTSASSPCTI